MRGHCSELEKGIGSIEIKVEKCRRDGTENGWYSKLSQDLYKRDDLDNVRW